MNVGDRVIAIRNACDGTVYIYGHGIYEGYHKPPEFPVPNPRIRLDNGNVVYGYQCWWGGEKTIEEKYKEYKFVTVGMEDE